MPRRLPLAEHLTENSIPVPFAGCWIWLGGIARNGYGKCTVGSKSINAHRLSWTAFRGPIPAGMHVLHTCDVPSCINPDHLWLGTHADNMRDCVAKGRRRGSGFRTETGVIGATYRARQRAWQAQIGFNGKNYYLGLFKRPEDATAAYRAALAQFTQAAA